MAATDFSTPAEAASHFKSRLVERLSKSRGINLDDGEGAQSILSALKGISEHLRRQSQFIEANAIDQLHDKITWSPNLGGLGLAEDAVPNTEQYNEILFQLDAWLESARSNRSANNYLQVNETRAKGTHAMTLAQKIFTQHALSGVGGNGSLGIGDVCRVGVDWILASELSWAAMADTYESIGSPGIWRNDRLWIAGDHVVHPDVMTVPKIKSFVDTAEKYRKELNVTEYQGMNYTIMHTEFVRERAEPGMLVFGSDSHSCSAGAVGCLSIGCGTADVMMTCALGETWFKIPESILIEFVGDPSFGMSGKDVILHILKELKRNTVAVSTRHPARRTCESNATQEGRIVEFAGPGLKHLSCDARFAICNMCTEFGAISGVFVPDGITQAYIGHRKRKAYRSSSLYFRPDEDAEYAGKYKIDLSDIEPSVAVYPNPDDVVPVSDMADAKLDGVFIGACTTTEEELVLGALVLKVGLAKGLPLAKGKRHYVPGSLPIVQKLQELGLLEIYQEAGFTRGPPGCSLCVGLSAEKASAGETWLSSQNRNFKNRMGTGSFGHLSTAMVCAASAFSMSITSPMEFLKDIDVEFFQRYKGSVGTDLTPVIYSEPRAPQVTSKDKQSATVQNMENEDASEPEPIGVIRSKIVTLPDFIDTDALAPGPTLTTCKTDEEFGQHVLEHTHPDFRRQVAEGQQIVVAGKAFGVGSSREVAVSALKGAGVKVVIARSFAFIYSRNLPALGLLGMVMDDDEFFELARDGEEIVVDVPNRTIEVGGQEFPFDMSEMEYELTTNRGVAKAYARYGKELWKALTERKTEADNESTVQQHAAPVDSRLKW